MYVDLPVEKIDRNPDQPRKTFCPEALAELAGSIGSLGLLEPILVRPVAGGDRWLIIAGERRWRAAQVAGLDAVPCRVMDDLDDAAAFELSVAENVNRHDMTPIEEARAYATLTGYGRDPEAIARLFGKTTRYVARRLDLLKLTDEIALQVEAGSMTVNVAQQVALLEPANQQRVMFKVIRGDFANDNDALHYAYALRANEGEISMFAVEEPTEEQREAHVAAKRKVTTAVEKAERLAVLLDDLAAATPGEWAALGDTKAMQDRLDRMANQIVKARFNARQGAAIADAATLDVSPAVAS